MRRAASLTILIVFSMLMGIPVFGQKSRAIGAGSTVKGQSDNVPVKFRSVQAFSDGRGAWLRWSMDLETNNFGFYIYRVDGGQKQLVNNGIVPGSAARIGKAPVMGTEYSYYDIDGGTTYVVESHDMNSKVFPSAPVNVNYVSDLTPLAGYSSEFMAAQRSQATDMIEIDRPGSSTDTQAKISAKQSKRALEVQSGVVAQDGVKIAVKKDGMYRVSRAQIEAAGFDVNTDPTLWQLYAVGAQQAMNVGVTGDYIEFYGKGIDEIESDTRIYYLVVGATPGLRMGSRNVLPVTALPSANFQYTAIRAPKNVYINTILNGDATNFFGPGIGSAGPTTINFTLKSLDVSNRRNYVTIELQGFSLTPHEIGITLNGMALPPATGSFDTVFSRTYTVSPGFLREGANELKVQATTTNPGDTCLFRSIQVDYRRKYIADQNQLLYLNENFREVDVTDFSSANIRIFDMTDETSPVLLNGLTVQQNGATWSVHIPQYRSRVMLGVEDSGLLQPASITPNYASSLATPAHDADLVIVSYKDWMVQAEAWADYRRGQGFDVEVVNVEDIYDEFNFGSQSNASITAFLQYARNNWNTSPQYVLLLGDASYDPRNFEGNGYLNFVPSKIVNTLYTEVPSDDALVDFNHDGLAEMSIGRIPGRSAAYMTKALNRVMTFEVPAMQSLSRGAVFASDLPNGFDFEAMSIRLGNQLPPGTPITYVNRGQANASATLLSSLNAGPYIVNYAGHGTVGVWAVGTFFGNSTVPELRNNEALSIYTLLTCLNGYFINPTSPVSLAENLMDSEWTDPNGPVRHDTGAIAVWASTGLTTPDVQEVMATRFYNKIGSTTPPVLTRMGDLVRDAKSVLIGGEDVRNSWVLLGDPVLQVRQPAP